MDALEVFYGETVRLESKVIRMGRIAPSLSVRFDLQNVEACLDRLREKLSEAMREADALPPV